MPGPGPVPCLLVALSQSPEARSHYQNQCVLHQIIPVEGSTSTTMALSLAHYYAARPSTAHHKQHSRSNHNTTHRRALAMHPASNSLSSLPSHLGLDPVIIYYYRRHPGPTSNVAHSKPLRDRPAPGMLLTASDLPLQVLGASHLQLLLPHARLARREKYNASYSSDLIPT